MGHVASPDARWRRTGRLPGRLGRGDVVLLHRDGVLVGLVPVVDVVELVVPVDLVVEVAEGLEAVVPVLTPVAPGAVLVLAVPLHPHGQVPLGAAHTPH